MKNLLSRSFATYFVLFMFISIFTAFIPGPKVDAVKNNNGPCVDVKAFFAAPNASGGVTVRLSWVPENGNNKWLKLSSDNFAQQPVYIPASSTGNESIEMLSASTVRLEIVVGNNTCFSRDVAINNPPPF